MYNELLCMLSYVTNCACTPKPRIQLKKKKVEDRTELLYEHSGIELPNSKELSS